MTLQRSYKTIQRTVLKRREAELTGPENSHSLCLGHTGPGESCLYVLVAVIGLLLCEETYMTHGAM